MTFKGLWAEFKEFAFKGNMIELAVAVIIGGAFGGVINSLVQDIIMPTVSYAVTAANTTATEGELMAKRAEADLERKKYEAATQAAVAAAATNPSATVVVPPPPPPPPPPPAPSLTPTNVNAVNITWTIGRIRIGNFLGQLLNFLIVAFAVFITIIKLIGGVMKKVSHAHVTPTTKECPFCCSVIPIKATKCGHCTADLPKG